MEIQKKVAKRILKSGKEHVNLTANDHRMLTGIVRDISELKLQNNRIEAEIHAKNEYISILNHELKTPLTAILGSLGLLLQDKNLHEDTKKLLSIAHRNTERLGEIIYAVTDVEKLQEGKMKVELKMTSLIPLVKDALTTAQFMASKKGITIIDQLPSQEILVSTDYSRLIQVCLNLLSNAIKFSPPNENIVISLELLRKKVRVSIQDHGCGIPDAFKSQIFTPFAQSPKTSTQAEGVGLGLHISKRIMDLFGGNMDFTSEENVGSTFYFELPVP